MKILLGFLTAGLIVITLASPVRADDAGQMYGIMELIRTEQYEAAIPQLQGLYWESGEYSNEALFLIIYCQTHLDWIDRAYSGIKYLKPEKLNEYQKAYIEQLKMKYDERCGIIMRSALALVKEHRWEEALNKFDYVRWSSIELGNKALFYVIYCQDKLYQVRDAQANIKYLKLDSLEPEEKRYVEKIRGKAVPEQKTVFVTPEVHYGKLAYSRKVNFENGSFSGVSASIADLSRSFTLAYDRLAMKNASPSPGGDFYQDQFAASYGRGFGISWGGRAGYIRLENNGAETDGGNILALSLKKSGRDAYRLIELSLSGYTNYLSRNLSVYQYSMGGGGRLADLGLDSSVYGELKAIVIYPGYPDDSTNALFNKYNASIDAAIRLYSGPHQILCGAWIGKQVFAVREGSVPYNVGDKRTGGARLSYSFASSSLVRLIVFGAVENVSVSAVAVSSYSYGASLSLFI